jgi:3-oxoacyl-ACP reductase-like protein
MGLFSNLLSKVFGQQTAAATTPPPAAKGAPAAAGAPTVASTGSTVPAATVDVTKILDDLAAKNSEKLDWRKSIVDLMKLVDMDSSLSARKELAKELNYSGDTSDSAKMNVWLHKEVIRKISENGGKVPQELLS